MISTTSESRFSPPDLEALVARSNIPVLIDCFTPGCGPCATLSPVLDELANSTQGRLAIEKIDVATYPEIAHRFGVRGVPTLLLSRAANCTRHVPVQRRVRSCLPGFPPNRPSKR
jgi:thioredoxin 1